MTRDDKRMVKLDILVFKTASFRRMFTKTSTFIFAEHSSWPIFGLTPSEGPKDFVN